ncbi:adenosylcobinamide-GDP ribazoletransferase [Sulfitobacter guttiformis]|uniref:Adenosylcobinamide-GDP ribazoletransferase n=1 Tax=Sulfitobacter guttiformis TaxID=74349 RepID=A0A420DNR9_9RHOB|nr:adenosylcobinamide-GDP ribazoletransferase [Sulfitobacter guttiformis]KIN73141.1 Cobalamin synthase [Sulfitobacter guttiformis KCTC 32187]RKE95823.1 cobalamin-5'-phosphate synthase [Sulfitobacter guttiformis]
MDKNDPLRQLWLAFVLLTRLPLPHLPENAFSQGPRAVWAYPLVGFVVGAIGALTGQISLSLGLPVTGSAVLALGAMILLTGAMHEDGLADMFDGFWGGTTTARRLDIMRDSQIGTYGVLALILVCLAKISALSVLLGSGGWAIVAAAALSRGIMPALMHGLPHARVDGLSRSVGVPPRRAAVTAAAIGALAALLCLGSLGIAAICVAALVGLATALLAKRKIGGQTGDVLGAAQQLGETAILLICAAAL